jgi:hypothetical protein
VRPPEGEFVTGELAADCARFLAETRRRVEVRRTVESRPLVLDEGGPRHFAVVRARLAARPPG